jgi:L-lactate dehydrogenase complex protein LldG
MQTFKTSKAKEKILSKIRNGLSKGALPMPFPEVEKEDTNTIYHFEDVTPEEAFAEAFNKLGGKFIFCENEEELLEGIHSLYDVRGWKDVICTEPELLSLFHNNKLSFISGADGANNTADACITYSEALIARTGSFIISSKQNLGRVATVFYPVHIVVAYTNQVVKDIQHGLDQIKAKYGPNTPSMINLNTGPSRTADIEKTLVVGVHGPAEVFCFLINS